MTIFQLFYGKHFRLLNFVSWFCFPINIAHSILLATLSKSFNVNNLFFFENFCCFSGTTTLQPQPSNTETSETQLCFKAELPSSYLLIYYQTHW